jgi:hypothetical protein
MNNTIVKQTKDTSSKQKKKNITFTFGENLALENLISELENLFPSMSKTEIAKLALIELRNTTLIRLGIDFEIATPDLVRTIKLSESSGKDKVLENTQDFTDYLNKV